jgi:hypothetical protein
MQMEPCEGKGLLDKLDDAFLAAAANESVSQEAVWDAQRAFDSHVNPLWDAKVSGIPQGAFSFAC